MRAIVTIPPYVTAQIDGFWRVQSDTSCTFPMEGGGMDNCLWKNHSRFVFGRKHGLQFVPVLVAKKT